MYHSTVPSARGVPVAGAYGHASVYDARRKVIYVHGGYKSRFGGKYELSGDLYSYEPKTRSWYRKTTPEQTALNLFLILVAMFVL